MQEKTEQTVVPKILGSNLSEKEVSVIQKKSKRELFIGNIDDFQQKHGQNYAKYRAKPGH